MQMTLRVRRGQRRALMASRPVGRGQHSGVMAAQPPEGWRCSSEPVLTWQTSLFGISQPTAAYSAWTSPLLGEPSQLLAYTHHAQQLAGQHSSPSISCPAFQHSGSFSSAATSIASQTSWMF